MSNTTREFAMLRKDARTLAARTEDALSFERYGKKNWFESALFLLDRGYNMEEAEAILRSKWMRWAADQMFVTGPDSRKKPTHEDLEMWIARSFDSHVEEVREVHRNLLGWK